MSEPIPVRVTRYRCPHCARSHSTRPRAVQHIGRCWQNPDARGCKTCRNFGVDWEHGDVCEAGVSLAGRPECGRCGGYGGFVVGADHVDLGAFSECPECGGDPGAIKPGPIVGCEKWERATPDRERS